MHNRRCCKDRNRRLAGVLAGGEVCLSRVCGDGYSLLRSHGLNSDRFAGRMGNSTSYLLKTGC